MTKKVQTAFFCTLRATQFTSGSPVFLCGGVSGFQESQLLKFSFNVLVAQ